MHNQPAITIQKWTLKADCITTGIRYPASINTTYLTDHQVTELIGKITAIGDPTAEQWGEVRAWAAEDAAFDAVEELARDAIIATITYDLTTEDGLTPSLSATYCSPRGPRCSGSPKRWSPGKFHWPTCRRRFRR